MDIPFNFLIGEDGQTYEGRGWKHESGFSHLNILNSSMAIGVLGNFTETTPMVNLLKEIKSLIKESIRRRKLHSNYNIYGIRNRTISEHDGNALFNVMSEYLPLHSVFNVT